MLALYVDYISRSAHSVVVAFVADASADVAAAADESKGDVDDAAENVDEQEQIAADFGVVA